MKKLAVLVLFYVAVVATTSAQQNDPEKLQEAVDTKTFVFEGRQASGVRGRMIQLDPGYTLDVSPERVIGNLPFFGRSYQGMPGSTDIGLSFEFSEFDYSVKPRKKGGWDITIDPRTPNDVRSVFLTIQASGNASLRIISNNKDAMSYNGFIK